MVFFPPSFLFHAIRMRYHFKFLFPFFKKFMPIYFHYYFCIEINYFRFIPFYTSNYGIVIIKPYLFIIVLNCAVSYVSSPLFIFECTVKQTILLSSLFLLLNFNMEEKSYTLTKEGVIGLLLILAGSYLFGFIGLCLSIVVSIGIITLVGD